MRSGKFNPENIARSEKQACPAQMGKTMDKLEKLIFGDFFGLPEELWPNCANLNLSLIGPRGSPGLRRGLRNTLEFDCGQVECSSS